MACTQPSLGSCVYFLTWTTGLGMRGEMAKVSFRIHSHDTMVTHGNLTKSHCEETGTQTNSVVGL